MGKLKFCYILWGIYDNGIWEDYEEEIIQIFNDRTIAEKVCERKQKENKEKYYKYILGTYPIY